MNSFSHYAFGAVCEWMFHTLAGIQSDGPGYKKIIIHPRPPSAGSNAMHDPIDWVRASYDSIRGTIRCDWKVEADTFRLGVTIPANTTATIYIPAADANSVSEGGRGLNEHPDIRLVSIEERSVVLEVGSGVYEFLATGGLSSASVALKTSKPQDTSINPDGIQLAGATMVAEWNFRNAADRAKWNLRNNCDIVMRDAAAFVVASGDDPQLATRLGQPLTGRLAIQLRVNPGKGVTSQFFWASPARGFNGTQQSQRPLSMAEQVNSYLFSVTGTEAIQKIRFDPFQSFDKYAKANEMEIESITVYRLAD